MLKAGVIGIGSMGRNHVRVLAELGALGGYADADPKVLGEMRGRFGLDGHTDYRAMLASDIEAVSIATPTETHMQIALDAIAEGKHVLVEKPLAPSLKDAERIAAAAERAGVTLAVGMIERHNPVVRFAKAALEARRFGDLVSLSAKRVSAFPSRIRDVGAILDLAIHDLDVMRYLIGSEAKSVFALGGTMGTSRFEDHANILVEFSNGSKGYCEANWLTPMKIRKLILTCTENAVELDYMSQVAEISSSQFMSVDLGDLYQTPLEYDIRSVNLKRQEPLRNELSDFLSAAEHGRAPLVTGRDALKSMRLALAAVESLRTGRIVTMPDGMSDA
ncbi:MAG: Gfo/Idh/MocA family oxidoreductase [Candidatus Thermoplasmatota archaeon]